MTKYDNHVFLIICEIAINCFNNSKNLTFVNYCRCMAFSLKNCSLTKAQINDLYIIMDKMDLIFAMTPEKTNEYILNFFNSNRITEFEKYIVLNNKIKPNINKLI